MKHNRSLSIIKDRKAKRFFALGSFIVVSAALGFIFLSSQQSRAAIPGANGRSEVSQVSYRLYESSNGINPGSPLANTNTAAALPKVGADFRLRVGLQSKGVSFKKLAEPGVSQSRNCVIMSDDNAYCWGEGGRGQLGNNAYSSSKTPVAVYTQGVLNGKTIKQITTGIDHTCVIASDDKVYCWGSVAMGGGLGDGTTTISKVPIEVTDTYGSSVSQIAAGYRHTCLINSLGKLYCWGTGDMGELGDGQSKNSRAPVGVKMESFEGESVKQVAGGNQFTCAVTVQGSVFCWGPNYDGRTGVGTTNGESKYPTRVKGLTGKKVESIAVGGYHVCAIISGGQEVYCWGKNNKSQLGVTAFGYRNIASRVPFGSSILSGGKTVKNVYASEEFTCMTLSTGEVYCWGDNSKGQMGSGFTTGPLPAPTKVNVPFTSSGETSMYVSRDFLCALRTGGELYCWGGNNRGQIGNGQSSNSPVTSPTLIAPPGGTIESASMKLRVEYAKKGSVATCSAVSSSDWQVVTGASKLAYSASGPADGTNINSNSTDPELPSGATTSRPQSLVRKSGAAGTFTNAQKISAGEVGVWDLALVDKGLDRNESYCVRVATDTVAAPGSLDIRFRDNAGTTLTNPVTNFDNSTMSNSSVITNALLSNSSSKQIEVTNTQTSSGWSVVLSASDGVTAKWKRTGGTESYMFNGTNGDQGFLSVNFGTSSVLASGNSLSGSTCQTSGISKGVDSQFKVGTATANGVTLMSSSGSTGQLGCAFLLQNVRLSQTIPAYQKPGTYELPMTLTVTAQ